MSSNPPRPYRFKSTTLKFQVPGLATLPRIIQNTNFIRNMSGTETWKTVMNVFHKLRTWSRMTIWGDRLFLRFDGPANILVQSRGARINDILSERQVNEIAGTSQGLIVGANQNASGKSGEQKFREEANEAVHAAPVPARSVEDLIQEVKGNDQKIANLTREGKIIFEKPDQKK
ncbi:Altered inheritance of mitochondria protein 24, mitochondrial [Elasticomyces elasticus]|nr:Altered inheritance of mitochondria protein 24, mitochondrial [Elasticomyces elasticus]